jgi:exopolyphosphatase / guanosine-5'-triphosphate,3'-diphosphate pyrophosphatase
MTTYDAAAIHLSRVFGAMSRWRVCEQVIGMTRKQRAALGPMHEVRVDVIGAGSIIVEQLAQILHNRAVSTS